MIPLQRQWINWVIELIDIALDKKTRAYAKVTAIETAFKILQEGIVVKQNKAEMAAIRAVMDGIENRAPDVIDFESDE